VLCAHRAGPFGVVDLNASIQAHLLTARLIPFGIEYFHGRPILITETDAVLELMNGDVGLVWHVPGTAPSVYFERPGREPLSIAPAHLPGHETAFAMTIHKSQGSEFEHVAVVLPPADSPLASRELLYTAITRARRHVTLIGDPLTLEVGLSRQVLRASGLSGAIAQELAAEGGP
jgi:exodeoxyribonuclease V alpha subunit